MLKLMFLILTAGSITAQETAHAPPPGDSSPAGRALPDIRALMQDVVSNQKAAEAARKDYIYTTTVTMDRLQKDGSLKKQVTDEYENFTLNGVAVSRHLRHDGKDLTAEEARKENERIDKEVEKARERRTQADAAGKETNSRGDEIIPISRMFELGAFTNPRRIQVAGRDTVAVDFTGDPRAKTHNRGEEAIHDMAGTAWIDEQDRTIQHIHGTFISNFKIGGGLVANIAKDTTFDLTMAKVNQEVWLPQSIDARGHLRLMLLFAIDGEMRMRMGNYRKFKATSTLLPVQPEPTQ